MIGSHLISNCNNKQTTITKCKHLQKLILIPTIISSLRIAAIPLFIYLYNLANIISCLILLAFSAATDFFDGYSARKLGATSRFGAYYDATTDFALVIGIFIIFYHQRLLPNLASAPHNSIICSIHSNKSLRKKNLRPNRQIHWKRPLHRHSLNACFSHPKQHTILCSMLL